MSETESDNIGSISIEFAIRNGWVTLQDALTGNNQNQERGEITLHSAANAQNLDCIKFLLEQGSKASCGDNDGNTPLHAAFKYHSPVPEVIQVLSKAYKDELAQCGKAEVEMPKNRRRNTPLYLAALYITSRDKNYCMRCIDPLKIFDPMKDYEDRKAAFYLAAESENFGMLEAMLSTFGYDEKLMKLFGDLLTICALKGNCTMVTMLIDRGADPRNGVLYDIITKSVDDHMAESMIQVYRTIIESANQWGRGKCQSADKKDENEETDDDYYDDDDHMFSHTYIRNLINKKHGKRDVTVLEHAVDEGAVSMLKAIFCTKELYKSKKERKSDGSENEAASIGKVKEHKLFVENCMPCYAGGVNYKISLVERIANRSDKVAGEMLEIEPLKHLTSRYCRVAFWFYGILTILQVGYMAHFTLLHIPSPCRFVYGRGNKPTEIVDYGCNSSNLTRYTNRFSDIMVGYEATVIVNMFWSFTVILISTLTCLPIQRHLVKIISRWCDCKLQNTNRDIEKISHGYTVEEKRIICIMVFLMLPPMGYIILVLSSPLLVALSLLFTLRPFLEMLFGDTEINKKLKASHGDDLLWPTYFPASVLVWVSVFQTTDKYEYYVACTAVVFIFGWLQVFYYLSFTKRFSVFTEVLRQIILKDVVNISIVMALVLLGFTYAILTLNQTRFPGPDSERNVTDTVYLLFLEMLSPGSFLVNTTKDSDYLASGGNIIFLRTILVIYLILTTVILLNVLIAQMSHTMEKTFVKAKTTWKSPVVRHCINLRSWFFCWCCCRDNSEGDTVPEKTFAKMFGYQRNFNQRKQVYS